MTVVYSPDARWVGVFVAVGQEVVVGRAGSNGTFVNGERITEPHSAVDGDVVRMGDTLLVAGPTGADPARPSGAPSGGAPGLRAALEIADRVAPSAIPVLLLGETGTGKEV